MEDAGLLKLRLVTNTMHSCHILLIEVVIWSPVVQEEAGGTPLLGRMSKTPAVLNLPHEVSNMIAIVTIAYVSIILPVLEIGEDSLGIQFLSLHLLEQQTLNIKFYHSVGWDAGFCPHPATGWMGGTK